MARLNSARSLVRLASSSLIRMAQISFSFRGRFCPTSFPYSKVGGKWVDGRAIA